MNAHYTLEDLNAMSQDAFAAALGEVYEHSAWIPAGAFALRPFHRRHALQAACEATLFAASSAAQTDLIRAHPDLATKLDALSGLTEFSRSEQDQAGFLNLPPPALRQLRLALNDYRERFGHPFILCVAEHQAEDVLPILKVRTHGEPRSERLACIFQIARIGWHRLCKLISSPC